MKIHLVFDISHSILYVPDGYVSDLKALQNGFFDWCDTQEDAYVAEPGKLFYWCYSKELFLRYINEEVLRESREVAYFVDDDSNNHKKLPRIVF